jgi:hypothetical protein
VSRLGWLLLAGLLVVLLVARAGLWGGGGQIQYHWLWITEVLLGLGGIAYFVARTRALKPRLPSAAQLLLQGDVFLAVLTRRPDEHRADDDRPGSGDDDHDDGDDSIRVQATDTAPSAARAVRAAASTSRSWKRRPTS